MGISPPNLSRRRAVIAGWSENEAGARDFFNDESAATRASAVAALTRMGCLTTDDLRMALDDPSPVVRRRALLSLPDRWSPELATAIDLAATLDDADHYVLEVACFVAGECQPSAPRVVERLCEIASGHDDPLCRESAVAALGSLGDPAARETVVAACRDKATIRRRAVLALTAFDGDDVDAMLVTMASDVDWQVRQAAEELLAIGSA